MREEVDLDGEPERLVNPAAELRFGGGQGLAEVRQGVEDGACLLEVNRSPLSPILLERGDDRLSLRTLSLERPDALSDRVQVGRRGAHPRVRSRLRARGGMSLRSLVD